MNIRKAAVADTKSLLKIYAPYVDHTAITFETEIPTEEEFAHRITQTLQHYPYLIAEENGVILGYAYATAYKTRAAYDWTAEVTVYIDREVKAKGIGTMLYHHLESELKKQNIVNLTACITAGNKSRGSIKNLVTKKLHISHKLAISLSSGTMFYGCKKSCSSLMVTCQNLFPTH